MIKYVTHAIWVTLVIHKNLLTIMSFSSITHDVFLLEHHQARQTQVQNRTKIWGLIDMADLKMGILVIGTVI